MYSQRSIPAPTDAPAVPHMSDSPASKKEDRAPRKTDSARRKVAVVQCNGFRCMAYQDNGKWHDYQTGEVLPEVLSIVLEFPV